MSLLNGVKAAGAGLGMGVVPEDAGPVVGVVPVAGADLAGDAVLVEGVGLAVGVVPAEGAGLAGVEPGLDAGYYRNESSQ